MSSSSDMIGSRGYLYLVQCITPDFFLSLRLFIIAVIIASFLWQWYPLVLEDDCLLWTVVGVFVLVDFSFSFVSDMMWCNDVDAYIGVDVDAWMLSLLLVWIVVAGDVLEYVPEVISAAGVVVVEWLFRWSLATLSCSCVAWINCSSGRDAMVATWCVVTLFWVTGLPPWTSLIFTGNYILFFTGVFLIFRHKLFLEPPVIWNFIEIIFKFVWWRRMVHMSVQKDCIQR